MKYLLLSIASFVILSNTIFHIILNKGLHGTTTAALPAAFLLILVFAFVLNYKGKSNG